MAKERRTNPGGDHFQLVAAKPFKHVAITQSDADENGNKCDMIVISAADPTKTGTIRIVLEGDADNTGVDHFIDIDHPFVGHIKMVKDTGTTLANADLQGFLF